MTVYRRIPAAMMLTGAVVTLVLSYDPAEPYAVAARFIEPTGHVTDWVFARDLLLHPGTDAAPVGTDVQTARFRLGPFRHFVLILNSPFGKQGFKMPLDDVEAFTAETLRLVPEGTESDALEKSWDIDKKYEQLINGRNE